MCDHTLHTPSRNRMLDDAYSHSSTLSHNQRNSIQPVVATKIISHIITRKFTLWFFILGISWKEPFYRYTKSSAKYRQRFLATCSFPEFIRDCPVKQRQGWNGMHYYCYYHYYYVY